MMRLCSSMFKGGRQDVSVAQAAHCDRVNGWPDEHHPSPATPTYPNPPAKPPRLPLLVIEQDAVGRAFQIVVLPRPQRPQEHRQPAAAEEQARAEQVEDD